MEPKFKVGDSIKDTNAYGNVMVMQVFKSLDNTGVFVYCVEGEGGGHYLAWESELT